MIKRLSACSLALFLLCALPFLASAELVRVGNVQVELVQTQSSSQHGRPFLVALHLVHDEGWHSYAPRSDTGYPTSIKWSLPDGTTAGEIIWPKPEAYQVDSIVDYIYTGEVYLPVEIRPSSSIKDGDVLHIKAEVSWLACKEMCVPGKATLDLDCPVSNSTPEPAKWLAQQEYLHSTDAQILDSGVYPSISLFSAVALGLLGGLLLNLMPCVFPILGLKVMSFVKMAGQGRRAAWMHALVFTLGVMTTFLILAAFILFLRSTGERIGWGFQLQNPAVLFVGAVVFLLFALNLNGVFEVGMSATGVGTELQSKHGLAGAFFTGVLAVVVATPCSAPFLGSAIGFAMVQPAVTLLAVFLSIGLGFALPYLIFAAFPSLLRWLPKPGRWMVILKHILSLLLYGTVLYLLWALSSFMETDYGIYPALAALAIVVVAAFVYGRWTLSHRKTRTRIVALAISILLIFVAMVVGWPYSSYFQISDSSLNQKPTPAFTGDETSLRWTKWQPGLAEQLAAEGHIVWVDFTARWCATCQVNKAVVFSSPEVRRFFREHKVIALKADWTKQDDAITAELAARGRYAVPFNVIYAPNKAPVELPTILTAGIVLEKLNEAL